MSSTTSSHLLISPLPFWGHARPLCVLAARFVCEQKNLVVTFVVAPDIIEKARVEISRQFCGETPEGSEAFQHIRILSPCPSNNAKKYEAVGIFVEAYPAVYQTLYQAKPITCSVTGKTFDAVPAPSVVILDFFALPQLKATRAVSSHSIPIMGCVASGAASLIRVYGPESMGGLGDFGARIDAEVARTGEPSEKIGDKIYKHTEGELIQIPGLPTMYDHEFYPQKFPSFSPAHLLARAGYTFFQECDAIIVTTSHIYETSVSLEALKQWLSGKQKEFHVLGPVLPTGYGIETHNGEEGVSADIEAFLGEMLVQHGKRSVFFVSFGTAFWPAVPEYIDELIEALIEKGTPFIMASASSRAKMSEHLATRVKSSGLGMLVPWSPQQFILNHPATGWFITHAGFNSITEALGSGIPLICWPFIADQPTAAVHLTENLNVAFELYQVRTGDGLKPIHRNGLTPKGTPEAAGIEIRQTIDLCRGEKGQELRKNAEKFKLECTKAWEEDGTATKEIRRFLQKYT